MGSAGTGPIDPLPEDTAPTEDGRLPLRGEGGRGGGGGAC